MQNSPFRVRNGARTSALIATGLALTLGLSACGDDPAPAPATVTVGPSVDADKSAVPEPEVPLVWPLTGVAVEEAVNQPAIVVKVENTSAARPQSGLEDADVVWETIVEFEVSRFVAVYHSKTPKEVGPVRSARPVDLRITKPMKPLFVFSGAQKRMVSRIADSNVQAISHDAGAAGLSRSSARRAPHNVYANLETILGNADKSHQDSPEQQFAFAPEAAEATAVTAGADTKGISLNLSSAARPAWAWDGKADKWLRSEGSAKAMTAAGKQLAATNVVVIEAEQADSGLKAQGGAMVPDTMIKGTGKALVATGGKTFEATWSKETMGSPLKLVDANGQPVTLAPGNTWVELMPKGKGSYTLS